MGGENLEGLSGVGGDNPFITRRLKAARDSETFRPGARSERVGAAGGRVSAPAGARLRLVAVKRKFLRKLA